MRSIPALALVLASPLALVSCSTPPALVAPVEFSLFSTSTDGIEAMKVSIRSVDFHIVALTDAKVADPNDTSIDDDANWYSQAINLSFDPIAQAGAEKTLKLGLTNVPEGRIDQIRVQIDALEAANNTLKRTGSEECSLDVTAIHPSHGTKISHPFNAIPARKDVFSTVSLSIDIAKSLTTPTADPDAGVTATCQAFAPHLKIEGVKVNGFDFAFQAATP